MKAKVLGLAATIIAIVATAATAATAATKAGVCTGSCPLCK